MNSNKSGKNLPSVNMISEGTRLEGTLDTKNDIRIAGTLDGEAKAKGKVIVSSSGKVEGNIGAADADIAGRVDGEVRVSNKLILRESAIIEGDIYTKTMLAEEGAQINGSFHMGENIDTELKSSSTNSIENGLSSPKKTPEKIKKDEKPNTSSKKDKKIG
ncbi:bactofilin family protein [Fodinibius halophilus]|uniref:Polymer-forming cytoskeletal protein n=1 Tax=Fodinibius halophilus TaxID=1736908 RepID=A0A6M1T8Z6_9BACT|nr:polymer-forming cytoskeletal protein [Fodinibius halophilus]NGP86862.1 polymer-forming cytoskeletal protein [Fodinibius halophilus]